MTMFPAHQQNLNSYGGYGGGCGGYLEGEYESCFMSLGGGSDLMAEDESRTEISVNNEEEGSSSKDMKKDDDGGWLQLSLGGGHVQATSPYPHRPHDQILLGPRLVELDLLPGGSGSSSGGAGGGGGGESSSQQLTMRPLNFTAPPQQLSFQVSDFGGTTAATPSFFLQAHRGPTTNSVPAITFTHQHQQYDNPYIPFRPMTPTTLNPPLSSSSSFSASLEQLPGSSSYHAQPLHFHGGLDVPGPPRMDFRVVDPPRRPHSGVWFMLQPSPNQTKEPYLPQIPKSYLRIKDGRTTVRLLIKYLVDKLKLDSEFEIEITCKGQLILPFLTLQHVRDNIWNSPRNDVASTVFPRSSATIDHLMVLNYGRIA